MPVTAVSNTLSTKGPGNNYIKWSSVINGNTGAAVQLSGFFDVTVQITGTFGGATCTIQGSMDNINWATLNDKQGIALGLTAAGMKRVQEFPLYIRPSVASGDGTTLLTIQINAIRFKSA